MEVLDEDRVIEKNKHDNNRKDLIRLRKELSQLDKKKSNLTEELHDYKETNTVLLKGNEDYIKANKKLETDIITVRKSIMINNLLKEIDSEDLVL
mmetsp:Transcript_43271/g.58750  ORF Transcript_43271/g.58750 Transcript_43271/m.58750 type:complete len:95 (+) Transcript_43271:78-362(+)